MFGSPCGQPPTLVPFAQAKPRTFDRLPCDGVSARNLGSFAARARLARRPGPGLVRLGPRDGPSRAGRRRGPRPVPARGLARALAEDLAAAYAGAPPKAADALARLLTGRDWLLLRYTET